MKYFELKQKIEELFNKNGIDEFSDIDWIMVEVLKVKRSYLPFVSDINKEEQEQIMKFANERAKHIPLAYILKKAEFFGYEFEVNENTLIPRQDTEVLIEEFLKMAKQKDGKFSVLDIGTGSGAIAVTLAKETGCDVYALDVSSKALEVAERNAKNNNADVKFVQSDVFSNIPELKVDFIVSNPPYIETSVIETLDREVAENEPILALDGGDDGLKFYKMIISEAKQHLNAGGMIFFEIGYNQAGSVSKLLENDFKDIVVIKDYGNNDRVVYAKLR